MKAAQGDAREEEERDERELSAPGTIVADKFWFDLR
jgi:hypothetical protein